MKLIERVTTAWMFINLIIAVPAAHMWAKYANGRSLSVVFSFYVLLLVFYLPQIVLLVFRLFDDGE